MRLTFEESHEVCLGRLLERQHGVALKAEVRLRIHTASRPRNGDALTLKSWAISLTSLWKGSLRMSSSVDFWYFRISLRQQLGQSGDGVSHRRATVPGLYLWGFFTPPDAGADFLAALVANCFLGALPPVDLRAVCLVRAILVNPNRATMQRRTHSQKSKDATWNCEC